MTAPSSRRSSIAGSVDTATSAIQAEVAEYSSRRLADSVVIIGRVRGRTNRLMDVNFARLSKPQLVTSVLTRGPSRDHLPHVAYAIECVCRRHDGSKEQNSARGPEELA
jgi:hypothetical protein